MSGDGSLGYWSHNTSQSSSHRRNDDDISEEKNLEVSLGDERHGHRSLDIIHCSSCNCGGYHSIDVGRGGSRSQETRHSSSSNHGTKVNFEGIGRYRHQSTHSSFHNPGDCDILLTLPFFLVVYIKLFMKKRRVISVLMMAMV